MFELLTGLGGLTGQSAPWSETSPTCLKKRPVGEYQPGVLMDRLSTRYQR
jgi:hypothetical protein